MKRNLHWPTPSGCNLSLPRLLLIFTWRSELILAGGAGQWQALTKTVHPIEADGNVCLRHGLQGFSWSERELGSLVGKPGLGGLGMSWTATLRVKTTHKVTEQFKEWWNWGRINMFDRPDGGRLSGRDSEHTMTHLTRLPRPWQYH